jgi:hypothetical protein
MLFVSKCSSFCVAAGLIGLAGCNGAVNHGLPAQQLGGNTFSSAVAKQTSTNLIANGSFEKPSAPSGSYVTFNKGRKFSNWTVSGKAGNVSLIGKNFVYGGYDLSAGCGDQWLDLTGMSDTKTGVRQRSQPSRTRAIR